MVLAIIALIAAPIVLNIIEKSRRDAAIASARSYIKTTETYVLTGELNKKDTLEKNNKYNVTKETTMGDKTYSKVNDLVEIKGTKPNGVDDYVTLDDTSSVVEAKLTINGYEILIKNDEVVSITKSGKTENVEDDNIEADLLLDRVQVGDYVAYDAGENRNNSVTSECYTDGGVTALKGWRVLKISDNKVYLVHAGIPECYSYANDTNAALNSLRSISNNYLNTAYAESAHNMTYDEAIGITGSENSTDNDLRRIGAKYWLSNAWSEHQLYDVHIDGSFSSTYMRSLGVRPVIVLKSGIKTAGKTTDAVGQEAWSLVTP